MEWVDWFKTVSKALLRAHGGTVVIEMGGTLHVIYQMQPGHRRFMFLLVEDNDNDHETVFR